ncbi:MAG: hypothetical protein VXV94_06125, partial [Cyanobacteriota bacterium]|nr:hypothetical protein [Cyanobacteriota bacterium]
MQHPLEINHKQSQRAIPENTIPIKLSKVAITKQFDDNSTNRPNLNAFINQPKSIQNVNAAHMDCWRHWILEC